MDTKPNKKIMVVHPVDVDEEHDCSKNFDHYLSYGRHVEFDYDADTVLFYGKCKVCGRQLVERFDFADVVDRKTGTRLSEIPNLDALKLAYEKLVVAFSSSKDEDEIRKLFEDFMGLCGKILGGEK